MIPNVSVIITTYNRAGYVSKAIESVLNQTYQDWELVIVDDGSFDETPKVVSRYLTDDKKVRYIRQTNQGLSAARNKGIIETHGTYLAFLDDDDWWVPEKLETQVIYMEAHPNVGLSYTRIRIIREINGRLDDSTMIPVKMATTFEEIIDESFIPASTVLIRRSCLENMNWFKSDAVPQEDLELWLRFVQKWKIQALDIPLTVMKKSDRVQLSQDDVKSTQKKIEIVNAVELLPGNESYKNLKVKHCARLHYQLGRVYVEAGRYGEAAFSFLKALTIYPLVGLMVRRPGEQGLKLLVRIAKSYLAVPICLAKGLVYGRR